MSPQSMFEVALAISFLVAIVSGLRAARWTDVIAPVLLVYVFSMVTAAIAVGTREPLSPGVFAQLALFLVFSWVVFGLRRAIGALWRRMRPSARQPAERA